MHQIRLCVRMCLLFLIFTVAADAQLWTSRYTSPGARPDIPVAVLTTPRQIVVVGSAFHSASGWDIVCIALNRAGDTLWIRTITTAADEMATAAAIDAAGNVVIAGSMWSSTQRWQTLVACVAQDGSELWRRTYSAPQAGDDKPCGIAALNDGGIAVAVASNTFTGLPAAVTLVYDAAGTLRWSQRHEGSHGAVPAAIAGGSSVAVAGSAMNATDSDAMMLLYTPAGV